MCSVFGLLTLPQNVTNIATLISDMEFVASQSKERGNDGFGFYLQSSHGNSVYQRETKPAQYEPEFRSSVGAMAREGSLGQLRMVGNCRAEPTTEWVKDKQEYDQQPYVVGNWVIAHNGTIANDADLRFVVDHHPSLIDSAAIAEVLNNLSHKTGLPDEQVFEKCIAALKGSFAILAINLDCPDRIYFACNYRPLWFAYTDYRSQLWFASARDYLPQDGHMIPPYSYGYFTADATAGEITRVIKPLRKIPNKKALVVCSGGLDSVVAATQMISSGYDVTLAHFKYGSRAEGPEDTAIKAVSEYLGVPLVIIPMNIYKPSDSPLLQADSEIAGGEAGAEFAHEWVPARNLVMLSLATAYCEAGGFHTLALGNNLEEAGAYPDNEPEFIKKFNDLLPFAVGDGKRLEVVMPVGNMMKHEIVALGHKLGAPMHLTWSCYRAGGHHCGTCGPCFMRRTAFKINGIPEVINYEDKDASVN